MKGPAPARRQFLLVYVSVNQGYEHEICEVKQDVNMSRASLFGVVYQK